MRDVRRPYRVWVGSKAGWVGDVGVWMQSTDYCLGSGFMFIGRGPSAPPLEKKKKGFIEYTSTRQRVPAHTRDSQDRLHPA